MKIVRKVLILTMNTAWSKEVKEIFELNQKVSVDVATSRTQATKLLADLEFEAILIEESFTLKNIDIFLRALTSQKKHSEFVYFLFTDFHIFNTIVIQEELKDINFKAHSLPMTKETLRDLVYVDLFPLGVVDNKNLDMEFLKVLYDCTERVLASLGIENFEKQKPMLFSDLESSESIKLRGKVSIKSKFFNGSILISFPQSTYLKIYNMAVGEEITEINDSNKDFAGEIANMVYGQAKKELSENGVTLEMAIPVIDESEQIKAKGSSFVIPVKTSVGDIFIKLVPDYF